MTWQSMRAVADHFCAGARVRIRSVLRRRGSQRPSERELLEEVQRMREVGTMKAGGGWKALEQRVHRLVLDDLERLLTLPRERWAGEGWHIRCRIEGARLALYQADVLIDQGDAALAELEKLQGERQAHGARGRRSLGVN